MEGYDWVVEGLKDQHYVALANEMEMDKAIQHLHRREFVQVSSSSFAVRYGDVFLFWKG